MRSIPEDLTTLLSDLETFLTDVLKGETLSKKAKEKKDAFIKRIKDVKTSYSQDFKDKRDEEIPEPDEVDTNDGGSLHSEQTDRDEESAYDGVQQSPPVAAQELQSILKSGFLEKRRKDHSFFGNEWQKRWCALNNNIFYYYGSEKDKQQKGEFNIVGYIVKMNNTLRKDAKRDCCFEISAPDKRVYQFCAASEKDAKEWVEHIDFLIKAVNKSTDYANYFQGLWDCAGDHPDELSFKRGDTIYILSKEYDLFGWWVGEMKGAIGIVPKEYLLELYML
ncbi:src kinase-associated phosphoprotein 2-like [Sinocyclocheilus grahami]|uniref:src kinase-associated phosphoprotein 2-like n=1 Tax=Sinocyclocheilus grahami TaxID=75366 RepID=UPI0007ACA4F5|nr:PREDICTED: src kinase-associated phosphoprotein 2-like [Sinocyclocheilus grahami]